MNWLARVAREAGDWASAGHQFAAALKTRLRRAVATPTTTDLACRGIPVVLLPGILEPWRFLAPLARHLEGFGHPVHFVPALGLNLASLRESTGRVASLLEERGVSGAVLVAHSKGGLVGKAAMLDPRCAERVAGMVAIATPFGGSSLAAGLNRFRPFARSPLGLFNPLGTELAALAAEAEVNARIVSLLPTWDQMVPDGSRLAGATNIELAVGGHFRPISDPRVWRVVHEEAHRLAGLAPSPRETMPG